MNASDAETIRLSRNTVDAVMLKALGAKLCPTGTVVFPKVGGALLTNKKRILGLPAAFDNNVMGVVPKIVGGRWLYYFLKTVDLRGFANIQALPSIRQSDIAAIHVPLPPVDEQVRIAGLLDRQMADVERARVAAEAQLEAAKGFLGATVHRFFGTQAPTQWPRRKLGEVAVQVQNGLYKPAEFYGRGHPFLRMYNIPNESWHLITARLALIIATESEKAAFGLGVGDLLISRVNSHELVGKCALVEPGAEGYLFENMLIRVRLRDGVDPMFVAQQFTAPHIKGQIGTIAKRAIGQSSISSEDLRSLEIWLPPFDTQKRVASAIDATAKIVSRLMQLIREQDELFKRLSGGLFDRAFTGGL